MFVETISFCDFEFMVDQCLRHKLEYVPTIIIIQYDEKETKNYGEYLLIGSRHIRVTMTL